MRLTGGTGTAMLAKSGPEKTYGSKYQLTVNVPKKNLAENRGWRGDTCSKKSAQKVCVTQRYTGTGEGGESENGGRDKVVMGRRT